MKTLLKWALRLLIAGVALVIVLLLSLDTIFKVIIERNIRGQTGLRADIGHFHLGLIDPVIEIKNLQLYSPTQYDGAPFLNIPEIHVEYDPAAYKRKQVHITLLRFNLGELDVVKNLAGETNIFAFGLPVPARESTAADTRGQWDKIRKQTGISFQAIDRLNVSVGSFKYLDLQNTTNDFEQKIGISNFVVTNVTSPADLAGLGLLVGLRSGDFFKPLVDPGNSGQASSAQDMLKFLGH